jgi:hypothetical protein
MAMYTNITGNLTNSTDYFDLMTPHWSNAMAKQYNSDQENFKETYMERRIDVTNKPVTDNPGGPVDNNPKTLVALSKPRLSDVPPVALFALGAAMSDGASKYGRYNYRDTSATASIFYDAIVRHLADWYNGEDYADDSKVHHLGHIMASCAILMDSELHGTFKDDRDKRKSTSISRNKTWIKND